MSAAAMADAVADAATAVDDAADGEATVASLAAAANVPAAALDDALTAALAARGGRLSGAGGTYRLAGGVLTSGALAGRHAAAARGALRGVATPTGLRAVAAAVRLPPRAVTAAAAAAAERGEGRLGGGGGILVSLAGGGGLGESCGRNAFAIQAVAHSHGVVCIFACFAFCYSIALSVPSLLEWLAPRLLVALCAPVRFFLSG